MRYLNKKTQRINYYYEKYFLTKRQVRQWKIRDPVVFIGLLDLGRFFFWELLGEPWRIH